MTQMERVGFAVSRDIPLFGEAGFDFRAAAFEFDETVVDGERIRCEIDARGVLGRIEARGTAF